MKKVLLCSAVASLLVLGGLTLCAQDQGMGHGGMRGQPPTVDQQLQRMTQQLNLTSDEQDKIKPILENQSQQMQSLRQDSSMSRDDRMTKMKEIHENTMSQIKPLLNSDQQKKLEDMMSHQGHHGGYGQGQGASPQSPQQ